MERETMKSVEDRPPDERALVERAREGDVRAYEELVQRHQAIAHRTAYLITGSSADSDDVTQEAFVRAYAALGTFRPELPFRPWILKIVANQARNRYRANGRRAALTLRASEDRLSGGAVPSPEEAVLAKVRDEELLAALERLGENDRLVIGCRYLLDLSEAETAAALGCRRGTVKSRLSRALGRLREELADG
jgi:RNA polymerase sigma-70 factor (ECF subfamily)